MTPLNFIVSKFNGVDKDIFFYSKGLFTHKKVAPSLPWFNEWLKALHYEKIFPTKEAGVRWSIAYFGHGVGKEFIAEPKY